MKKRRVILCVDDEQIVLNTLNKQLQKKFGNEYDYEFAESAQEGLEIIEEVKADGNDVSLIISDQIMPGLPGDKFLEQVHQMDKGPIKVLLTGQAAMESAINAINNAGLFRFLQKPWDEEDFLLTVEKGLQQYNLVESLASQVKAFSKFVPEEFLKFLEVNDFQDIKPKNAHSTNLSVLFLDIRSFTKFAENLKPEQTLGFLNHFFNQVASRLDQHHGFIDKFLGDGLMALFPRKSEDAVLAGLDILKQLRTFNQQRIADQKKPVYIGVGVHSGEGVVGIIGWETRMNTTVIGQTVNLASRVEELTKVYGTPFLISGKVFAEIPQHQNKTRFIAQLSVRGNDQSTKIYEVLDQSDPIIVEKQLQSKASFETGVEAFQQQQWDAAQSMFTECLEIYPQDTAAQAYLTKIQQAQPTSKLH